MSGRNAAWGGCSGTPSRPSVRASSELAFRFQMAGQMTHVLRHTFASHFMMNGGNILTL